MVTKKTIILMAEDDDGHALLIKRSLRKSGMEHEIIRFEDGEKLLDFLKGNSFKSYKEESTRVVLLLDIRMPKMDGIEVLEQIKSFKDLSNLPVIMLTTTSSMEEITRCYRLGCNSYMVKPIQHAEFMKRLQSLGLFLQNSELPDVQNFDLSML